MTRFVSAISGLFSQELAVQVLSGVLVTLIVGLVVFLLRDVLYGIIKKIRPQLESKTPHVNFEVKNIHTKSGAWKTQVTVSNAANEPAYNLYVVYFEQFPEGNFKITPSNSGGVISRPVLGINDSLKFEIDGVMFEGCNVTCWQEIWIEYDNSLGVHFRAVSVPPSPRGDLATIKPPKVISERLEQVPGFVLEGNKKDVSRYIKGRKGLFPRHGFIFRAKWWLKERMLLASNKFMSKEVE